MGWAGIKNGELMRLAEKEFEIFITVDRNLSYQQNLSEFDLALIVLQAKSNRIQDLLPFADLTIEAFSRVEIGKANLISLTNFSK